MKREVVGLDLLRFFAASLVMLFHLSYWSWASKGTTTSLAFKSAATFPTLGSYTQAGWVGVEIFFVISGFVIAFTAEGKTAAEFLLSRIARLYPAAWICATITLCAALAGSVYPLPHAFAGYLRALLLFPKGPWIDGAYWTLRNEIAFYSAIYLLLLFKAFRRIEAFAWAIGVASTICCVGGIIFGFDYRNGVFQVMLLSYGSCFALGIFLWSLTKRISVNRIVAAVTFATSSAFEVGHRDHGLALALYAAALCFFVVSVFYNDPIVARLSPRTARATRAIGLATYPLYLLHAVAGAVLMRWLILAGVPKYAALIFTMASAIALALLIVFTAERSIRRVVVRAAATFTAPKMARSTARGS